jgi:hypothetical protein
MATISGFLNELRAGGSSTRQKWDARDREGAMDDYRDPDDGSSLSGQQKLKIRNAATSGNLQPIQKACEDESASGEVHVYLWVK